MCNFGQVHLEIAHLDVLEPPHPHFRSTVMEFLPALDRKVVSDSTMELNRGSLLVCSMHVSRLVLCASEMKTYSQERMIVVHI